MSQIIGEIRLFAFSAQPAGWQPCDGRILSPAQNPKLFAIITNKYGGNGTTTFALPDLRGRILLGQGNNYAIANKGGEEMHTLAIAEMAAHNHGAIASSNNMDANTPTNNFWPADGPYQSASNTQLSTGALAQAGGNAAHQNMAPFLALNYCMAVEGEYPPSGDNDYAGVIKPVGSTTISPGWAVCDGSELPVSQFTNLFSVIGYKYGGNGKTTFCLPDLRGKAAVNAGQGNQGLTTYNVGDTGGSATVTLTQNQLPSHSHVPTATLQGNVPNANPNAVWANPAGRPAPNQFASALGTGITMNQNTIASNGGGGAHNNMMPYLVANYIISLNGNAPPRQ